MLKGDKKLNYKDEQKSRQIIYKDAITEEDWVQLIDKHKLRYEIWMILKLDNELNVTQISHRVKQSKSTVSRVMIQMEKDGLIKSRRAKKKKGEGEKIPPKFYRINEEYRIETLPSMDQIKQIEDPNELQKLYKSKIKNYRNYIYNYHKLLDLLSPLLNVFEDQLDDIDRAKEIFERYLSDENEPWFTILFFNHEHFKEFLDIRLEYLLKLEKLARDQKLKTDNAFVFIDASLPLKAIFELKKEMFLKRE